MKPMKLAVAFALGLGMIANCAVRADTFGSGANTFIVDFVTVGNAGNSNDAGAGGGSYFDDYGGVNYSYRMGVYEISQNDITKATNLGMANVTAGAFIGDKPAANISWYEAAAFVNWLNTSKGYQAAYNLTFISTWSLTLWGASDQATTGVDSGTNPYRHKNAYYFLPSEDEWYKAAYHKNDGVTANYWDYATGSNTAPTAVASGTTAGTAVYDEFLPADVTLAGGLSSYGTMGQNGNVYDWAESAGDGSNNINTESRVNRGGSSSHSVNGLRPWTRYANPPADELGNIGFRVASVPEPSAALLLVLGCGAWLLRGRLGRST